MCELDNPDAVAIVVILIYVFAFNLFTLVKGATAFVAGKPEEILAPAKAFLKSFIKKLIASIKTTVAVADYCSMSHTLNEAFYLLKTELAVPTQDFHAELRKVHLSKC